MARTVVLTKGLTLALVVLSAFFSAKVQGQRQGRIEGQPLGGQIVGQVRYAGGQPATEVLVNCEGFSGGLVGQERTDRNGRFRFQNLGPAQFTVSIRHPGYVLVSQTVELMTTSSSYVQLQLTPDPSALFNRTSVVNSSVPPTAQKEYDKAEAEMAVGKKEGIEQAVRHYEQAVSIYPGFVQARLRLGTAYMDLQQWDKAEQALKKTLELDPKAVNALFALGETYLRQKKIDEAEKVLLQGLQIEDRSYQGHLTLARVYWDMASKIKDEAAARPPLEKSYDQVSQSLKLNENLAEAHLLKGNLLLRVRRAQDALSEFEEYLRLEPNGEFAEQTRGLVERIKKALASQNTTKN